MKLICLIFLYSITVLPSHCQDGDTLFIDYDKNYFREIVKDTLRSRYILTKTTYPDIDYHYPLDSLNFYIIPLLSLQMDKASDFNCGDLVERYVDFNIQPDRFKVILEYKQEIVGYFLTNYFYEEKKSRSNNGYDILNRISFQNKTGPKIIDGQFGNIEIYKLTKDFFTFRIPQINADCILEDGNIFVVEVYNNSYKQIPINKYVREEYGKNWIRKLNDKKRNSLFKNHKKGNLNKTSNGIPYIKLSIKD